MEIGLLTLHVHSRVSERYVWFDTALQIIEICAGKKCTVPSSSKSCGKYLIPMLIERHNGRPAKLNV